MVICQELGTNDLHGPADATATPSSLASLKPRMVYLSGACLSRLSWKRGHWINVVVDDDDADVVLLSDIWDVL